MCSKTDLIYSVAHFLDEYLGLHLTDFLNWLSYIFDVESTKETQKVRQLCNSSTSLSYF